MYLSVKKKISPIGLPVSQASRAQNRDGECAYPQYISRSRYDFSTPPPPYLSNSSPTSARWWRGTILDENVRIWDIEFWASMPACGFGKDLRPNFAFSGALENFLKFNARFEFFVAVQWLPVYFSGVEDKHTLVLKKELAPSGAWSTSYYTCRPVRSKCSFRVTPFLVATIFTVACSFPTPPPP